LAKGYFKSALVPGTSLNELDKVEGYLNRGKQLSEWLGIRVYEPEHQQNGEIAWHLRNNPSDKLKNIMTIGIHEGHAVLIKDIEKLAKIYVCGNCRGRFTKPCHLQRHMKTCTQGKTVVECPNEKVKAPLTNYERTFYDAGQASQLAISWLEKTSKSLGIHIHHAMCGHGGKRYILGAQVDGYVPKPETIFQYHGCWWHGCRRCFPDRNTMISHGKTREDLYIATRQRTQRLREAGYRVIEKWECEDIKSKERNPQKQTKSYPHFIFYDFETYQDKTKRKEATNDLTYENTHVPISVSIGDTLEREPTFICDPDAKTLIKKFMEELERRGKNIREAVRKDFMPEDMHVLTRKRRSAVTEWYDQVPVLGFNCGRYDLNLIKEHFAELLADTTGRVQVAKKANTTMFMKTDYFIFLDIINYLGPGTSYDAWVKAYGCSAQKSGLPYEWFDTPAKMHHPGLPDYPAWYSKLKDSFVLKLSEFKECRRVFKEKGDENLRRLVVLLQQPGRSAWLRGVRKDESLLHRKRDRHSEGCSQPPGGELALSPSRNGRERRRDVQPQQRSVRHAEKRNGGWSKHSVQSLPRGRRDTDQVPQIYENENMSKNHWLRRQRTVPINDDERDAVWERRGAAFRKSKKGSY